MPEHEMAKRIAHLATDRMLDFIDFDDDYALVKTVAPKAATDQPLGRSRVRSEYGVTIAGIKRPGEDFTYATADTVVEKGDTIVGTGKTGVAEDFTDRP
ncbi:TrkA C-terminal domain-containing protein [Streptomyces sp. SJL17-4]|uniref:TrkA C-terminal domain-containing protein n=1 Tax=Streptomyces sp. SJL17-4 TaxID=2967224 RepID=UPI0030CCB64D